MSSPNTARASRIAAAYVAGKTLQWIGDEHGISRERVRQIVTRLGLNLTPRPARPKRVRPIAAPVASCHMVCFVCQEAFETHRPMTIRAKRPTCSPRCRQLYAVARPRIDSEDYALTQARHVLKDAADQKDGQVAWANRVLVGTPSKRASYNRPKLGSAISLAVAEVERLRARVER